MNLPEKPGSADIAGYLLRMYRDSGARDLVEEQLSAFVGKLLAPDPYRVLGVDPGDPPELIRAVYRVKIAFYSPDNLKTGSPDAFKKIQAAYEYVRREEAL